MKKSILLTVIILFCKALIAQTSVTINVGGDADKYYPISFSDAEWNNNVFTEVNIGRSNVHLNSSWQGSMIANFKYHVTNYGHGSSFINSTIYAYNFIAGWVDATAANASGSVLIWLKGGGVSYMIQSRSTLGIAVYDGTQNVLPYQEQNGPARTFKTTIDDYVNLNGTSQMGNAYFNSNGIFLGNVGIGTTAPKEKLSVNGNIRAREVKVEANNWPDYVFDEGYKIGTLEELESYIKANKHLPDMPGAKTIEVNGIAVSEMLKLQQQKIEELTLYLVSQNKSINTQNKKLLVQGRQIKLLKNQINIIKKKNK
jgi:hypothetical protein